MAARDFSVLLQRQGRRKEFNLGTANKSVAARKAREIDQHLRVNGWEPTLAKYKPFRGPGAAGQNGVYHGSIGTVGEFVAAILATQTANRSLADYIRRFRQIVAEIFFSCERDADAKYDYRSGGRAARIAKIDAVRLDTITSELIQKWKVAYLARADGSPAGQRAAKIAVNSTLRQARSLFSPKRLEFISLPEGFRSPFANIRLEPRQSCRYRSTFVVKELLMCAREELSDGDVEAYKAFLLALLCGLRRGEIDRLEWSAFNFENRSLHIEVTEHLAVKSQDSIGAIDLEPEFVSLFRTFKEASDSSFVIDLQRDRASGVTYRNYRCEAVFCRLSTWLRDHGLSGARKPLHALRKEFGSVICDRHGIYAASPNKSQKTIITRIYEVSL